MKFYDSSSKRNIGNGDGRLAALATQGAGAGGGMKKPRTFEMCRAFDFSGD